jgi:hypothetical protein
MRIGHGVAKNQTGSVEYQPLPTTREERGRQIAKLGGIRKVGARFAVPSQSIGAAPPTYLVDLVDETCTCPDYELRRLRCKHQEAVWFWLAWEGAVSDSGEVPPPAKRKTYAQNWPAYNAAQTTEKARVEMLLKSLCEGIEEPPRKPGPGRPRLPLRDSIFSAVMKVYTTFSGRRASTDIRDCAERGSIADAPHYNSIFRCLENPKTTAILTRLIEESAAPLAEIENVAGQFAQDSTGFSTVTYDRWFDQKHGIAHGDALVGQAAHHGRHHDERGDWSEGVERGRLPASAGTAQPDGAAVRRARGQRRQGVPQQGEPRSHRRRGRGAVHPVQGQQHRRGE